MLHGTRGSKHILVNQRLFGLRCLFHGKEHIIAIGFHLLHPRLRTLIGQKAKSLAIARQKIHSHIAINGRTEIEVKVGDEITTLPSNETAHVKSIHVGDKLSDSAFTGQPVTIQLDREVDVSRGCVLTIGSGAKVASSITATILWMDDDELFKGKNFFFKLGTKSIPGIVTEIKHTIDVNTGEEKPADKLKKNEIAVVKIAFSDKIVCDKFKNHKTLGEFILIDRVTDMTSACGVVEEVHTEESGLYEGRVDRNVRAAIKGQKAITAVFVDGVDGVNRGFVEDVEKALNIDGRHTYLYAPKEGEDFVNVVKHLSHAGILVLLLISQKQEKELEADKVEFTKDWNKNGRDVDNVKVAESLKAEFGVDAQPFYADLSKTEASQAVFDWTVEKGYRVDVLISNAGLRIL